MPLKSTPLDFENPRERLTVYHNTVYITHVNMKHWIQYNVMRFPSVIKVKLKPSYVNTTTSPALHSTCTACIENHKYHTTVFSCTTTTSSTDKLIWSSLLITLNSSQADSKCPQMISLWQRKEAKDICIPLPKE